MDCPKCVGKLQKKDIKYFGGKKEKEKDAEFNKDLEVDQCFVCGGVWFDHGELNKYVKDRLTLVDSGTLGGGLDSKLDEKEGNCPRCKVKLKKEKYEEDVSITVDVCERCGGIWLDSTEIDRIEKKYPTNPFKEILDLFKKDK